MKNKRKKTKLDKILSLLTEDGTWKRELTLEEHAILVTAIRRAELRRRVMAGIAYLKGE